MGIADDGAEEANVLVRNVSDMADRGHTRAFLAVGDVHVESHRGANCGEPPLVPERPVLRVVGIVGPLPCNEVRVRIRLGQEGQRRGLLRLRLWRVWDP